MFSPGDTVAVGVSGGADSMCLLALLRECAAELGITLTAVHVNHGIRGAEADRDEAFVRDWCREKGVSCVVRRADIPAIASETRESTELCARRVRYEILSSLGADKIATAHTGSDSVETMLMNLSRGAGLHGLGGIPPVRGNIVRPLIGFTREETERYCEENGVLFVTDSTNLTDDCTRNRFRHRIVPELASVNPAFTDNALRCMALLRQDDECLRQMASERFDALFDPVFDALDAAALAKEPASLRSRVLILFFDRFAAGDYEYRHIELLTERMNGSCSVTLPSGGHIVSDGSRLVYRKREEMPSGAPKEVFVLKDTAAPVRFGKFQIVFSIAEKNTPNNGNALLLDYDKIGPVITVRGRLPGDRIALPRRGCAKTVKKYLNEIAYPAEERDGLPVLCDSQGVIALAGLTADASRLPDENTKKILLIKTEGDTYDQ
jgi:tRNA(Ile)-lysidine synthase